MNLDHPVRIMMQDFEQSTNNLRMDHSTLISRSQAVREDAKEVYLKVVQPTKVNLPDIAQRVKQLNGLLTQP